MNVAGIVQLILTLVTQLLPLAEQLRKLAVTTTVAPEQMAAIDAQLKIAHDRLGALIGAGQATNG
jgi:hypothetical protein